MPLDQLAGVRTASKLVLVTNDQDERRGEGRLAEELIVGGDVLPIPVGEPYGEEVHDRLEDLVSAVHVGLDGELVGIATGELIGVENTAEVLVTVADDTDSSILSASLRSPARADRATNAATVKTKTADLHMLGCMVAGIWTLSILIC